MNNGNPITISGSDFERVRNSANCLIDELGFTVKRKIKLINGVYSVILDRSEKDEMREISHNMRVALNAVKKVK